MSAVEPKAGETMTARTAVAGGGLGRYLLGRLLFVPFALFILVTASFLLVNLAPGDPAEAIVGATGSPAEVQAVRVRLGLDKPMAERYVAFVRKLAVGDLGTSFYSKTPVIEELRSRFPSSLLLIVPTLLVGVLLGVSLGSVSAYYQRRIPDKLVRALVSVGQACPEFLFGALLIFVFFYVFQIAPAPIGQHAFADALVPRRTGATVVDALLAGDWATFRSGLRYLVLPVLTGAMPLTVIFAKTTRAVLAEALEGPAAEYARANALSEGLVVRWALKQVRTPLITYVGILVPLLIGGGAIVEILYSWNGLGQYAVQSIQELDVPVIQAYVLFVSLISLISYIVLDVVVVMLDPRLSRT